MFLVTTLKAVIAYVVSQRIREIDIRTALGAQPAGLLGMFVRHGLWLVGIGAAVGLVAAAGLTRLMPSLLFGVTAQRRRITLVLLARFVAWRELLTIVRPDTLVRWHRDHYRLCSTGERNRVRVLDGAFAELRLNLGLMLALSLEL